ncbi:MAG TPA: hypothetical protein PLH11_11320 [Gemmobacter sp.]|nr:hypothetical protein [Gemmobacter sp.]
MPRRKAPSFKSGAIVRCESTQEEEAVARFEACPSVTKITAQPVRIAYMHEGKQRRTTPDFKLTLDDGLDVYVEIKHTTQALTMAAVLKARAVGSAAQGLDYRVITNRWIRVEPLLENIRILQRWRGATRVSRDRLELFALEPDLPLPICIVAERLGGLPTVAAHLLNGDLNINLLSHIIDRHAMVLKEPHRATTIARELPWRTPEGCEIWGIDK